MKIVIEKDTEHEPNYKVTIVPTGIHEENVEFFMCGEKTDHVLTPDIQVEII